MATTAGVDPSQESSAAGSAPARASGHTTAAAQMAALLEDAGSQLDDLATDLTQLYRANIPVYGQVDEHSIRRNTRAVLELAAESMREPVPGTRLTEIAELARVWAQQQIPLELVAHSIQVGARRLFELVRERASAADIPSEQINDLQDLAWQWATAHAAAVHMVQQERAVAAATRRSDFVRKLVAGAITPAALATEASSYHLDMAHRYHVVCARWDDTISSSDLAAAVRMRGATAQLPSLDAIIDDTFVALLPQRPQLRSLSRAVGLGPAVSLGEASRSHRQALEAMTIADRHGRTGLVDLSDLGSLPLLEQLDEETIRILDAKHLGPLRAQGNAGHEILTTIATYLTHDRKVEETARALFVHRNTIRYRLTRFAEVTGLDTDKTDDLVLTWCLLHRDAELAEPANSQIS